RRVQELLERFEKAWDTSPAVDLADFLPRPGDPLRLFVLQELVRSELEIRWRRGQSVLLEKYLEHHPELNDPARLPSLIYWEYCVRQRHGDHPPLDPYQVRFPAQFSEVKQLAAAQPPTAKPEATSAPVVAPGVAKAHNIAAVGG